MIWSQNKRLSDCDWAPITVQKPIIKSSYDLKRKPKSSFLSIKISLSTSCAQFFKTHEFTTKTTPAEFHATLSAPKFRFFLTFLQVKLSYLILAAKRENLFTQNSKIQIFSKYPPPPPNEFGQKKEKCTLKAAEHFITEALRLTIKCSEKTIF